MKFFSVFYITTLNFTVSFYIYLHNQSIKYRKEKKKNMIYPEPQNENTENNIIFPNWFATIYYVVGKTYLGISTKVGLALDELNFPFLHLFVLRIMCVTIVHEVLKMHEINTSCVNYVQQILDQLMRKTDCNIWKSSNIRLCCI